MKMLKHRNRERDGWMPPAGSPAPQAALPATTAAGPAGVTPEASAPAAPAAPAAPHSPPVSILTNASSVSQPASANSAAALDRPRKKLSFRDPEVTGTANSKEVAGLILAPGHLASLRDQGISNSIEDMDLEVLSFCCSLSSLNSGRSMQMRSDSKWNVNRIRSCLFRVAQTLFVQSVSGGTGLFVYDWRVCVCGCHVFVSVAHAVLLLSCRAKP